MIAAGFFTENMGFDLTVLGTVLGMFGTIIGMLASAKKSRKDEIRQVVGEVINASPNKVVVDPQPFLVKMEKELLKKGDLKDIERRVANLEQWRESDKSELRTLIDGIPARVIATLDTAWRMKPPL